MSRYFETFSKLKITAKGKRPQAAKGAAPGSAPAVTDKPVGYPKPSPTWPGSFNRATKMPVVKTRVDKHGVD